MSLSVALVIALSGLVVVVTTQSEEPTDYSQAQIVRLANVSQKNVEELKTMEDSGDLEMMSTKVDTIDVLLLNDSMEQIKDKLDSMNMEYDVIIEDVQETIIVEKETMAAVNKTNNCDSGSCFNWNNYYRLAEIYDYLDYLQDIYPQVNLETVAYSAENRPIKLVKINTDTNTTSKKAIWIDGGVHAREWITPAAATYIVHEILTSLQANESMFTGLDYYILPVMNPDGYEYSHTTDRFWRKNRSVYNDSECIGTDLNRNWNFKWGGQESKNDPCSSNYRGPHAFSELETASVSSYMLNKSSEIQGYLSLHSYGQNILFPWAYTYSRPSDYKDLNELAYYMSLKVKAVGGVYYKYGAAAESYYVASGGSQDWTKGEAKIKYSYTMELRDTGKFAFSLPVSEILATSKDAFAAFTILLQKIKNNMPK